jgi:hypothetical protein
MFTLKPLSKDAIPAALEKANRYRLLNEPGEAESICHDVLGADPDNQQALVTLVLALTDRLGKGYAVGISQAGEILARVRDPYERTYVTGILCERRGKARLHQGGPGARFEAYEFFREAMAHYEKAGTLRPAGSDDPLLRWNACARIIMQNRLEPRHEDRQELSLE